MGVIDAVINRMKQSIAAVLASLASKLVVILFLLLTGLFLVSALNNYLHTVWGPVGANLAMAGGFFVISVIAAIVATAYKTSRTGNVPEKLPVGTNRLPQPGEVSSGSVEGTLKALAGSLALSPKDADLALTVAKVAIPLVLPKVLKVAARNLPVVGLAAAAIYLVARHGQHGQSGLNDG